MMTEGLEKVIEKGMATISDADLKMKPDHVTHKRIVFMTSFGLNIASINKMMTHLFYNHIINIIIL